jgi:formylglycine-generating enzyme required for sulfatase activity
MDIKYKTAPFLVAALVVILAGCGPESVPTSGTGGTPTRPTEAPRPTQMSELSDTRIRVRGGMNMVYVPAGQFEMGSSDDERARPVHTVALDAFWIDKTEVTNAMFTAFLNEQGNQVEEGVSWLEPGAGHRGIVYGHIEENDGVFRPQTGYEDYPVIEVSWYGAAAYCSWVGGRLPTEAEWEYAARGPQARAYPWGNTFDGERANYCDASCSYDWRDADFDDEFAQWAPVGTYPGGASWCGALDMAGNVWEWVNDWWSEDYYAHSPADNPQGPDAGTLRIARGGSWFDESWRMSPYCRKALTPSSYRMHWVGFRCVVSAQP